MSLPFIQQWTMTIVDRSSENSDHESVGCQRSPFTSGDVGMDGSCSSSWAVGPTMPSDSPRLKVPGGCLGPAPGAVVYNGTPSSVDRPKEQGRGKCFYQLWYLLCTCLQNWKKLSECWQVTHVPLHAHWWLARSYSLFPFIYHCSRDKGRSTVLGQFS